MVAAMPQVAPRVGAAVAGVPRAVASPRVATSRGRHRAKDLRAKGDQMLREVAGDPVGLRAVADLYRRAAAAAVDDPDIHIRHAIALVAVGRHKDADRAIEKATAIDGRLADRPAGESAAVVVRGHVILREIAAVADGPLPGELADVAALWTGTGRGPMVRLAAAGNSR